MIRLIRGCQQRRRAHLNHTPSTVVVTRMGHIFATIIPIFSIVALGAAARFWGFLTPPFMEPANRLVYYLAIPAMIFRAIANASLDSQFHPVVAGLTLLALILVFVLSWAGSRLMPMKPATRGAFIQGCFHGNLGYIGLAVAFYHLGGDGLAQASILAAFIMILQNFLAVVVLQSHREHAVRGHGLADVATKIVANPVIVSAAAGIVASVAGVPIPLVVDRSLKILSGLALPMALLIIGGSLSMSMATSRLVAVTGACLVKLMVLPATGMLLFHLWGVGAPDALPAIILLASPTATIAYVMAREMGADATFAVAAITASTLMSAVTFSFWLSVA
jgi:predicted permease